VDGVDCNAIDYNPINECQLSWQEA
jgi:hypothetical protein